MGSFDSFRSKLFAKVISCFESFSLNEYDLLIVSVADALWSVHETPICWESTMQNKWLSIWQNCLLWPTTNEALSHTKLKEVWMRENPEEESKMQTHSLS